MKRAFGRVQKWVRAARRGEIRPLALWVVALALCAGVGIAVTPRGWQSLQLLIAADDPAALTDIKLTSAPPVPSPDDAIADALAADDVDLARSFVDLTQALENSQALQGAAAPSRVAAHADALASVTQAEEAARSPQQVAGRFVRGFVTGTGDDVASLAGTVAGDLFVFGDIRDAVREGGKLASGEEADTFVLGLAGVGLAVTAGTYASGGAAAPARVGVSVVKAAARTGRIGPGLSRWLRQAMRGAGEASEIDKAGAKAGGASVVKTALQADRAGGVVRFVKDVGRVQGSAGTRAALDALKIAESPAEMARAAKLAERKGSQTRAIFKTLGRGALVLGTGLGTLLSWTVSALMALIGFLMSVKAVTERLTQVWIDRSKAHKIRRAFAAAA